LIWHSNARPFALAAGASRTLIARVDGPNERPAELFNIGGYR